MILLANSAQHMKEGGQPLLGGLDIEVNRNHFGSQLNSFEAALHTSLPGPSLALYSFFIALMISVNIGGDIHGIFIRAPGIMSYGNGVEVLATLKAGNGRAEDVIVAVKQNNIIAAAFHV